MFFQMGKRLLFETNKRLLLKSLFFLFALAVPAATAQENKNAIPHQWTPVALSIQKSGPPDEKLGAPFNDGTRITALLHIPGRSIVGIEHKKSNVEKMVDDKNNDLLKRLGIRTDSNVNANGFSGKYAAVVFHAPHWPGQGATKIRIKGTLVVLVGKEEAEIALKGVSLKNGADWEFGKFTLSSFPGTSTAHYSGSRPIKKVVFLDEAGKEIRCQQKNLYMAIRPTPNKPFGDFHGYCSMQQANVDRCTMRVTYFRNVERVVLPVNLEVGLGLNGLAPGKGSDLVPSGSAKVAQENKNAIHHQWTPAALSVQKSGPPEEKLGLYPFNEGTRITAVLHIPARFILGIDQNKSNIEKMADDKNKDLFKSLGIRRGSDVSASDFTGKYAAVVFRAPHWPGQGATKIRIKGTVVVLVGKEEAEIELKGVSLKNGVDWEFGKFTLPPFNRWPGATTTHYSGSRPIKNVLFLDGAGKEVPCQQKHGSMYVPPTPKDPFGRFYGHCSLQKDNVDRCTMRVTYFKNVEQVVVPVNLEVGLGLNGIAPWKGPDLVPSAAQKDVPSIKAVEKQRFEAEKNIASVACSDDGNWLAIADAQNRTGKIDLWETKSGNKKWTITNGVTASTRMAFSRDGKMLLATLFDRNEKGVQTVPVLRTVAVQTGKELFSVPGGGAVAFHPDGFFAAFAMRNLIQFRNAKDGNILREIKFAYRLSANFRPNLELGFSPDGQFFTALTDDVQKVHIFKAKTGEPDSSIRSVYPLRICFSPDSKILATGGLNGVELWDVASGKIQARMKIQCQMMAFSPNGKWLAVAGHDDGKTVLSLLDIQTGNEIYALSIPGYVKGLAFPRNDMLVYATNRAVRIFELSANKK